MVPRPDLGHAVDLREDRAERRDRQTKLRHRHRPRRILDQTQRRGAALVEVRQVEHVLHHHRRQMDDADLLALDVRQHGGDVIGAVQDHPSADVAAHQVIALGADMVERHHQQHGVGRPRAHLCRLHLDEAELAGVIEHRALRPSRGAAGVDQIGHIARARPLPRRMIRGLLKQRLVVLRAGGLARADDDHMADVGKLRPRAACDRGVFLVEDQHVRRRVLDDVFDLGGRQPVVDGHRDETRHLARGVHLHIGVGVLRQDGDAVLPPHPHVIKRVGEPVDARALLAETETSLAIDQRNPRCGLASVDLDQIAQRFDARIRQHRTSPFTHYEWDGATP